MPRKPRLPIRCGKSIKWYDAQLREQNGGCAICGRKPRGRRLAVDHNHKSLVIRGLLDYICNNRILGRIERFKIDPRKIVAYFEKYDPEYLKQFGG